MKKLILSVAYVVLFGLYSGSADAESAVLRQYAEEDGRRTLEAVREMVRAELEERIPRLAREALAAARPEPLPPGTLVVERRVAKEAVPVR